jgi:receptor protein-tyrosine kinase
LASALAQRTSHELLLVDANLRRPRLASRLGVEAGRGLADVLMGAASWPDVVRRSVVPGADVLPGVEFPPSGGRLPEELNLAPLWEELGAQYRLVLVDTASLVHREVAAMARRCSGTYLVVRLGHTPRPAAREAAEVIRQRGGRLLGCVVLIPGLRGHGLSLGQAAGRQLH